MSIRFAAPPSRCANRMTTERVRRTRLLPANDTGGPTFREPHLHAALRHFALHGIAAARNAREQAMAARRDGDAEAFDWWLGICLALDRRMADGLARSAGAMA